MTNTDRKYQSAATLLFMVAVLHLPVLVLNWRDYGAQTIFVILVLAALGMGLILRMRWVAYLAFIATLGSVTAALAGALSEFSLVALAFWAIAVIDVIAAAVLFGMLWTKPAQAG
ncbi:hypothetical protein [Puniceibacterium sp. IMCC21224]|uniref:hypothetical protein n=1 Tax=Puniceibacterium sp. IMCC21224 TaxID=1618204 RepID=UPI00064DACB9|nr:hypothetical protein [Puniceibacterium sp. IMCC21224]KMK67227.1 hypothetical protein IMCC21224_112092 [Puniceibacterium sp. IMCC21224]